jgi:hypothetical protein
MHDINKLIDAVLELCSALDENGCEPPIAVIVPHKTIQKLRLEKSRSLFHLSPLEPIKIQIAGVTFHA